MSIGLTSGHDTFPSRFRDLSDDEVDALVSGTSAPTSDAPLAASTVSPEATALTRQLAARHLEVLAQSAADAVEGRRLRNDPRIAKALGQTRRLAQEMEDAALTSQIEALKDLLDRIAETDASDRPAFARRLRDTVLALADLAGGSAGERLRALTLRRVSLHPLAGRLRTLQGIGERRLARLWEAGLLSLDSLLDATPDDLVTAAGLTKSLAERVLTVAHNYRGQRAIAVAEALEVTAEEARNLARSELDQRARERLVTTAARARRDLASVVSQEPPPLPPMGASNGPATGPMPRPVRYKPLARLGVGGQAEVLRARFAAMGGLVREVAVKRLKRSLLKDAVHRERLLAEARLLTALDHENVIHIHDMIVEPGDLALVLELVRGADARRLLEACTKAGTRPAPEIAAYIAAAVAGGLGAIHALSVDGNPVVHGDVSPANVMLGFDGRVKLIDLGIAALRARTTTPAARVFGKPAYLAPESVLSGKSEPKSDQFALGTMLWEMLTAKRLFHAPDITATLRNIAELKLADRFARHDYIPVGLQAIVARALSRTPDERFGDIYEMRAALLGWLDAQPMRVRSDDLARFLKELVPAPHEDPLEIPGADHG